MSKRLEKRVLTNLEPAIDEIMQKFMGVRIHELGSDISMKLSNPLLGLDITQLIGLPYKEAKKRFKQEYLKQLLLQKYGNISEVARIADMERRSVHRLIEESDIDVNKIREEMLKPKYVKEQAVGKTVGEIIQEYKEVLHPNKLQQIYERLGHISRDLADQLPDNPLTMKQAEKEFEREYFKELLLESKNVAQVARRARIRYETAHRKMKLLGLI